MRSLQVNISTFGKYVIIVLLLAIFARSYSQPDTISPAAPVLLKVTVNPANDYTELTWSLSPSADVAGYIVYQYLNDEGYVIDTIFNSFVTGYSFVWPYVSARIESFVVTAFDASRNISRLSNPLHTIFCESRIDSCSNKIVLSWNEYTSYPPGQVAGYDILESVSSGTYHLAGHVTGDILTFDINDFSNGSQYCFFINAILTDNSVSSSNKSCLTPDVEKPPVWINADYATVTPANEISLAFTYDPASEINKFVLERKTGPTGTFSQINVIYGINGSVTYTDRTAKADSVNYYRLSAINNCNEATTVSNVASNIVLAATDEGNNIILSWNKYRQWLGSVASYRLFTDTGKGFAESASVLPADSLHTISIPEIMYTLSTDKICFYIEATEGTNPYGITGQSISQRVCSVIEEKITVPNLFTPDGDQVNDLFRPVVTFTPSVYQLVISDRNGKMLFESHNFTESWDGTVSGDPVPEGVYLWHLKARTPAGKNISRTGTITVFRTR
ncbi:MAG: gliding motility-associated C-terminal domain-containing protein [Bacteroidales bacterium]